jgi:transcriptional regulator with XRE-family HTH domain
MDYRRAVTPLKLAVVASGRRQKDIAAQVGLDEATFSRIVNGLHAPDATRAAIAQALDVPEADLWPTTRSEAA